MTWSRRKFLVGLSATVAAGGVTVPAVYVGRSYLTKNTEITPGEASLMPATAEESWLAHRLKGVWDISFSGDDVFFDGVSPDNLQLVLDVEEGGRSLRGFLGQSSTLHSGLSPEYRVLGDLVNKDSGSIRWRLIDNRMTAKSQSPLFEFEAIVDEVWGVWAGAGGGTLSGRVQRLDRSSLLPELDFSFMAKRQQFMSAKETVPLSEKLLAWLISPTHRLFHQLWHASRDRWHTLSEDKKEALRGLGWQPGDLYQERDARGDRKHLNGSGEDFLFMHRDMIKKAINLQPDLVLWKRLPLPAPNVERDYLGFIRYYQNLDGSSVPPAWEPEGDPDYFKWLRNVKGDAAFYANYQVWESQYQDPNYLSKLTLAELGSELELGMHDWLHMRWATVTRDPTNGQPYPWDRLPSDFSPRWFRAENDYLGDPFSSHVNPVFWMFHGWIDDRIEDWYRAHERFHPGEVKRKTVKGVPWFAVGRWVEVADPWLGASYYGCSPSGEVGHISRLDDEEMKLAISIATSNDDAEGLLIKAPRRPWYARHQVVEQRD